MSLLSLSFLAAWDAMTKARVRGQRPLFEPLLLIGGMIGLMIIALWLLAAFEARSESESKADND